MNPFVAYCLRVFFCFSAQVDKMLAEDISKLMVMIPQEDKMIRTEGTGGQLTGGAFDTKNDDATPFG